MGTWPSLPNNHFTDIAVICYSMTFGAKRAQAVILSKFSADVNEQQSASVTSDMLGQDMVNKAAVTNSFKKFSGVYYGIENRHPSGKPASANFGALLPMVQWYTRRTVHE